MSFRAEWQKPLISRATNAKQDYTAVAGGQLVDSIFRTDVPSCSFTDRKPLLLKEWESYETPRVQRDTVSIMPDSLGLSKMMPLVVLTSEALVDVTAPTRENEEKLRIGDRLGRKET